MRKYLIPVFIAGFLGANLAMSYEEKRELIQESIDINHEISDHYDLILSLDDRTEVEQRIIRNGYNGFLNYTLNEFYEMDPEAKPEF